MPSTVRTAVCGLLIAGASAANKAASAKYIVPPGQDTGAFGGLSDALKDGGAQGLIAALGAMKMSHMGAGARSQIKIKKDEDGNDMYDFVETTTATTTTVLAPTPPMRKPLIAAAAAAAPGAPALAAAVPQYTQALPAQMAPAAFLPMGAGSGTLPMLAAGLAAVRSQVDLLAAEANAAVGNPALAAAPQAPQAAAPVSAKVDKEIADLTKRMDAPDTANAKVEQEIVALSAKVAAATAKLAATTLAPATPNPTAKVEEEIAALAKGMSALEEENDQLKRQVTRQDLRLQQVQGLQSKEEIEVANLTAQDAALRQALVSKRRLRHHKHKAEVPVQAAEAASENATAV